MAAPVNANINVFANTEQAMAQFRALQAQVAATNKSISATSGAAVAQQAALNKALMDGANASRMWSARMVPMNTAVQQFSTALDKGKLSLGQYTRYAASQLPGMSRVFKREFDMMSRVAESNVKRMQTQYVALGNSATGAAQAMALTPTALNKHAAASAIAAQRQMMLNRMIDLGTTKLLNWGKNTQWAGRQLMVGFSIPLAMLGAVAAKTFKEIDKGSIAFKRVYGDLSTTTAEMERNLQAVKDLGAEYTRYGLKLSDTIELAADVAATGARNNDLLAATEQTLRLSTLGLMEYGEALEATISLQTAFGVSSEDLGSTIDFLNVVENETILTMQDMAAAIPRVAPVIKGLGGDVRDLAVLMTAMREGGVTAAEGANALKTGLGRLINPTKAARDVMDGFGISLTAMIQSNRGNLMGMINDFGTALATLDDFEQQQALEKVFGKRQYARLGALFKNIANDASQAQRTVELTNMSLEELGAISERELGKIEEATSTKFAKAVEQLKISIAPIGEQFMKALTPVISFITKIADKFNDLPENIKNAISIGIAAIAGIGPVVLMTVGLIANGIANIGKLIQTMRKFFARLRGNASAFQYLTTEEQEAAAAARSLSGATDGLTGKFLGQQKALERLIQLLGTYQGALASTAAAAPLAMGLGGPAAAGRAGMGTVVSGPQSRTTVSRGYNDGVVKVPGVGNRDTVPAMLTPGESVVTKEATQRYAPVIAAMNAGKLPGFIGGVTNLSGIPVPAPVASYNIKSSSVLPVQALIEDVRQIDGGLDAVTAVLREFAQTGRLISKTALTTALEQRGVSLARSPMYSQARGNVVDRSHVLGLGVERTTGLLSNLNAALQSSNPVIKNHAQQMLENAKVVQLYKNGQDVLAKEVTETSQVFDVLQRGTMALTGGFKGTVMGTPQAVNNLYNQMPRAIRGDTLSLDTFNQQVRWAEQEFRELASRLNLTTAELADDAVINNMVDESEKQRINALRLLIAEGQEVAQLQMTEQEFMRSRLKQMGLALQAEKGQTDSTIANAEAERFATQQMQLLRQAGVIATDATIDYATAMQVLASSALGQAGSLVVAGQNVPQQVAKRAAQRRTASGYAPVANMRSIPTSTIPTANPAFTAATQAVNANRFAPIAAQQGITLGTALGNGITQGSIQSTRNTIPEVIRLMGHNSPHPLMAKTGTEDGTAWGNSFNQAVKRAIMTGSGKIVPPGGVVPPPAPPAGGGKPQGYAAQNAAALKSAIMAPTATAMKEVGTKTTGEIRAAAQQMTGSMKAAFTAISMGMQSAVEPFITPMKTMAHKAASIIIDGFSNASIRIKSAYETAALKTMMALDSVKSLPAGIKQAAATARGRLTNMFQTMVPDNFVRRMRNKIFYGGQDVAGKARQVGGLLGNRVPRAIAMDAIRQKGLEKLNSALTNTSGRIQEFSGKVMRAGQLIMNPVPRAIALDAIRQRGIEKLNAAITPVTNAMTRLASGASTAAQILMNPVPRAIAMEVVKQRITQAGKFVADTIRVNFQGAMQIGKETITQGFNTARGFIVNAAQTIKGGIDTAGVAIKNSLTQVKTGIQLAVPEIKNALKSAVVVVKESGKALGSAIMDAASKARAAASGFLSGGVDSQGRTRGQRLAGSGNTAMMGLMGLSMAASFAGGEVGEMAQKIMPVTMGLMGLQMILPMLTSPLGLAIIAITAAVGSFIYLRKQLDDAAKAAANVGANMNGVANAMKIIEDATGFKAPDNKDRLFRFTDEDREAMGEFGSYFESESGSKFIKELKEASSEERYQRVFSLLSQGIASGLEEEKAKAFGFAIAEATGDALLKSSIARDFANQIFEGGSARLLEMEEERIREFPTLPEITGYDQLSRTQKTVAERNVDIPWWQKAMDMRLTGNWQAMPSIGDFQLPSPSAGFVGQIAKEIGDVTGWFDLPDIPMITSTWTEAAAESETVTEKAAKGLGYYLQTVQNLANAEAVLEEERRNGLITFDQYTERFSDLQGLQNAASDYIGEIFSIGADAGSMKQALGDQLSFAGFSEEQIKRITDRFNPDALAQEIFGAENFQSLELKEQKDYIEKIMTETLSGLSPENVEQRLADVEGTYTDIAEKVVQAMVDGSGQGIDFFFNQQNMADYISQRMGGGLGATLPGGEGRVSPGDLAENLLDADMDLKRLGTDALEVFTRLTEFNNQDFAKSIMNSKDEILNFGDAVTKLSEYEDINIEVVMEKGIDPDSILYAINQIKDIEFDTDIFGNAGYDADLLTQKMIDLGYNASEIPGIIKTGVQEATSEIGELSDKAFNELNNIKITPNTMLKLFDTEYASSEGFMSALESAFPDELPPSVLPILLQILNPEQLQALAGLSKGAAAALMDNPDITSYSPTGGMYGLGEQISESAREGAKILNFAKEFVGSAVSKGEKDKGDDTGGGGGGGSKEKTALEELQESIAERTALYLGITKAGKKLDKAKKGYFGRLLAETTTNNSIANQLRKLNLSETLIADILEKGSEGAQEIINQLGPNGLKKLSKSDVLSRAGLLVEEKRGEANRGEYKATAKRKLEETGKFTAKEIEDILQDEDATEIIALLPKKAQKVWRQLIRALRGAADATKEVKTESEKTMEAFETQSSKFDQLIDLMNQGFDAKELETADAVAKKFFDDNTGLAEKLAESTGHTVENGYQLAEAMQRQISLNERLIDKEQDRIDQKQEEIDDYSHINDLIQQGIDSLKRQEEMRSRRSESLSRDLEQIAEAEDDIRESYEKRMNALDKVAEVNDYIIQQQKQQLDLSQAISEGDIYAATQAAQEMRAASAERAVEQRRAALEEGMENAIAGLVSGEGMTRVQIEDEINNIKEQNYQTSLLIRAEEDRIYQNNLQIKRLSNEIYDIQENIIEPLQNQNDEYSRMLDYYKEDEEYQISRITLAGMTREQFERQADALQLAIDNAKDLDPELKNLVGRYNEIYNAAKAAADESARLGAEVAADEYAQNNPGGVPYTPTDYSNMDPGLFAGMDFSNLDLSGLNLGFAFGKGGKVMKYAVGGMVNPLKYTSNEPPPARRSKGGSIGGDGSRDSVPAMLTPGEFVIRKAMVDKYGMPMLKALNQGSFAMPRYNVGEDMVPEVEMTTNNMVSNINAPVYNTYDMKFAINGSNQSADEIANSVMFKMRQLQNQGVRSNRGY